MTDIFLCRNPRFTGFDNIDCVGFISSNGSCYYHKHQSAPIARLFWEMTYKPVSMRELAHLLSIRGFEENNIETVRELLIDKHILISVSQEEMKKQQEKNFIFPSGERNCSNLLVCISGAVGSAMILPYLELLRASFCRNMKVVLTQYAKKFITIDAIKYVLDVEVYHEVFEDALQDQKVPHIALSKWADCVFVVSASAALLHRIANGSCDDLASLVVTATPSTVPVIIAPNMNVNMWHSSNVQRNIKLCKEHGYWIINPGYGMETDDSWEKRIPVLGAVGFNRGNIAELLAQICSRHKMTKTTFYIESHTS
ncbi:MAG: flavoprotein [Candidatus Hodarchaeota archaeon]